MTYLELRFSIKPLQPACEILVAELAALGFESFVEEENGLLAYIQLDKFEESLLGDILILESPDIQISWSSRTIEQQNWNAEWERNFHPIKVGDKCIVRAPFHDVAKVSYDIVIEPKMSFGTGHHETTYMMLQLLLQTDFNDKSVLDMGCGTAVLAILAAKRGAAHIDAVDIDSWCYDNALENVSHNNCSQINVFLGDGKILGDQTYDVIIANINRNILLEDIPKYAKVLNDNGRLLLSGFYIEDLEIINKVCTGQNLVLESYLEKNKWVATVHRFS